MKGDSINILYWDNWQKPDCHGQIGMSGHSASKFLLSFSTFSLFLFAFHLLKKLSLSSRLPTFWILLFVFLRGYLTCFYDLCISHKLVAWSDSGLIWGAGEECLRVGAVYNCQEEGNVRSSHVLIVMAIDNCHHYFIRSLQKWFPFSFHLLASVPTQKEFPPHLFVTVTLEAV